MLFKTGVWVYANENKTEVGLPGEYSVTATTVDGTLEIGFLIKGATGNYVCVDNFRLTHEEPTEETYAVFREEMGKLLAEAEKIDEQLSTPEQKALNEAVATAKAILAQSSWKVLSKLIQLWIMLFLIIVSRWLLQINQWMSPLI